jgi:hypothetical protein
MKTIDSSIQNKEATKKSNSKNIDQKSTKNAKKVAIKKSPAK